MDSVTNKQRIIDAWQTFRTRDAKQIASLFTADAEWLAPADNATARRMGGTHRFQGRERIAHFIAVEFGQVFVRDVRVEFSLQPTDTHLSDAGVSPPSGTEWPIPPSSSPQPTAAPSDAATAQLANPRRVFPSGPGRRRGADS